MISLVSLVQIAQPYTLFVVPPAPFEPGNLLVWRGVDPGRHWEAVDGGRHYRATDPGRHWKAAGP